MEEVQPLPEQTITAAAAAAAAIDNDDDDSNDDQHQESKELAIQTLLEIIDSNEIQIDDQLRRAILGQGGGEAYTPNDSDERTTRVEEQRNGGGRIRGSLIKRFSSRTAAPAKRESVWGFFVRKHAAEASTIEKEISAEVRERIGEFNSEMSFECRVSNGSYTVEIPLYDDEGEEGEFNNEQQTEHGDDVEGGEQPPRRRRSSIQQYHIPTVTNAGAGYKLISTIKRFLSTGSCQQPYETKAIMKDVNLVFEEGKMYLILGAPGCGKSTLLKMIAGRLPESGNGGGGGGCFRRGPRKIVGGNVEVNGVHSKDKDIVWSNIVSYVDQIERLHGYLTVKETVDFAFDCCWGGTHRGPFVQNSPDTDALIRKVDKERWLVDLIMRAVGIKRVADTYVGNERVRGVSGGEKKRVSVAEMLAAKACKFVVCFLFYTQMSILS